MRLLEIKWPAGLSPTHTLGRLKPDIQVASSLGTYSGLTYPEEAQEPQVGWSLPISQQNAYSWGLTRRQQLRNPRQPPTLAESWKASSGRGEPAAPCYMNRHPRDVMFLNKKDSVSFLSKVV